MHKTEKRIIDTFTEAEDILRTCQGKIILYTNAYSSSYMGIPYFIALNKRLHTTFPDKDFELVLNCGSNAGEALSALSYGIEKIIFSGNVDALAKLSNIAQKKNAKVLSSLEILDS